MRRLSQNFDSMLFCEGYFGKGSTEQKHREHTFFVSTAFYSDAPESQAIAGLSTNHDSKTVCEG